MVRCGSSLFGNSHRIHRGQSKKFRCVRQFVRAARHQGSLASGADCEGEPMAMLQSGTTARAHGTHAHASHQPHGSGVRGLTLEHIDHFERLARQNSPEFEGRFRRMFNLPAADPDDASLDRLAAAMKGDSEVSDEPDTEESDIPAAYTYLGQFIDHDLTFDPSTLDQQRSDPAALVDFRTPRFDLDNLYGRGPADQPYFYYICVVPPSTSARNDFLLGDKLLVVKRNPNARDLPRAAANAAGTRRTLT